MWSGNKEKKAHESCWSFCFVACCKYFSWWQESCQLIVCPVLITFPVHDQKCRLVKSTEMNFSRMSQHQVPLLLSLSSFPFSPSVVVMRQCNQGKSQSLLPLCLTLALRRSHIHSRLTIEKNTHHVTYTCCCCWKSTNSLSFLRFFFSFPFPFLSPLVRVNIPALPCHLAEHMQERVRIKCVVHYVTRR